MRFPKQFVTFMFMSLVFSVACFAQGEPVMPPEPQGMPMTEESAPAQVVPVTEPEMQPETVPAPATEPEMQPETTPWEDRWGAAKDVFMQKQTAYDNTTHSVTTADERVKAAQDALDTAMQASDAVGESAVNAKADVIAAAEAKILLLQEYVMDLKGQ